MGADLEAEDDDAVEDPRPDPADVAGGVDSGGHQADPQYGPGGRCVGADLLVKGNEGGADE